MTGRIDVVGVLLLCLAGWGAYRSYDVRADAARRYAEAADYNRAITAFLKDHRARLRGRPVAVYGVAGLSPWSLSAGGYLARQLGEPRRWDVFVRQPDTFYPLGALPGGSVTTHADRDACAVAADPATVHLVVGPDGRSRIAESCAAALALAEPKPVVETWGPPQVSAGARGAGFAMYFTGHDLVRGVEVRVGGQRLPTSHAKHGALMTAAIPPQAGAGPVPFALVLRDRVVFEGRVDVR